MNQYKKIEDMINNNKNTFSDNDKNLMRQMLEEAYCLRETIPENAIEVEWEKTNSSMGRFSLNGKELSWSEVTVIGTPFAARAGSLGSFAEMTIAYVDNEKEDENKEDNEKETVEMGEYDTHGVGWCDSCWSYCFGDCGDYQPRITKKKSTEQIIKVRNEVLTSAGIEALTHTEEAIILLKNDTETINHLDHQDPDGREDYLRWVWGITSEIDADSIDWDQLWRGTGFACPICTEEVKEGQIRCTHTDIMKEYVLTSPGLTQRSVNRTQGPC